MCFVWVAVAVSGCDDPECDPARESCELAATFVDLAAPAGHDDDDWCVTWRLDNPTDLWVNTFTQTNTGYLHHANYFFVPEHIYDVPDGLHRCSQIGFSEVTAALSGGVLFAQSTQALEEQQQFPAGVAIRVPARVRIVGNVHLLNSTDAPNRTNVTIRMETIPADSVDVALAPFRLNYEDLIIPARSKAEFTSTCDLASPHESIVGGPLDLGLYWVLPHYHARGSLFRLQVAGGPRDGEEIYRLDGYDDAGDGRAFDPAFELAGATGITFTCGFDNRDDVDVRWGIKASDEMCMMLGFARMGMAFDATVERGEGTLVSQTDGVYRYTGPCGIIAQIWDR